MKKFMLSFRTSEIIKQQTDESIRIAKSKDPMTTWTTRSAVWQDLIVKGLKSYLRRNK
jgi:hypothetical protein